MMIVERVSTYSGKVHSMKLPITPEQIVRWTRGELIQNVMPDLTPAQREFLICGITQEEWDTLFGDEQ